MKLCKRAQIIQASDSVIRVLSGDYDRNYSNNIGPANIIIDDSKRVTRAAFLINNHYTELPTLVIEDPIKALFYSYKEDWRHSSLLKEVCLDQYSKRDFRFYAAILAIKKTNLFIEYLNQNKILSFELNPINSDLI
jgi:hypothetical protein